MAGTTPSPLRGLIFDVDGTLAETEELHRRAFNESFARWGLDWHWSREHYRRLLATTGGKERIAAHVRDHAPETALSADGIARLHGEKTAIYDRIVGEGTLALRPGIAALLAEARRHGLRLAIATTTSRPNVETLSRAIWGRPASEIFDVIASGDEVLHKKPDPEIYRLALARLELPAGAVIAFEDSRNGLLSATGAGIATVVAPGPYTRDQDFGEAALVVEEFTACLPLERLSARLGKALPATATRPGFDNQGDRPWP